MKDKEELYQVLAIAYIGDELLVCKKRITPELPKEENQDE